MELEQANLMMVMSVAATGEWTSIHILYSVRVAESH